MPKSDGKIAIVALIALAAWLFVVLPLLYLPRSSDQHIQSLWVPTDSVGLYTLVLSLFTALLAFVSIFQGFLLLRADKTARIAADAAKRSADSAFAAERARFFIVIESHNLTAVLGNVEGRGILAAGENFSIRHRFQNYGKTPAIIKVMTIDSMIATDPAEPPIHFLSIKDFPEYMIGAGGSTKVDWYSLMQAPIFPKFKLSDEMPLASGFTDGSTTMTFLEIIKYTSSISEASELSAQATAYCSPTNTKTITRAHNVVPLPFSVIYPAPASAVPNAFSSAMGIPFVLRGKKLPVFGKDFPFSERLVKQGKRGSAHA